MPTSPSKASPVSPCTGKTAGVIGTGKIGVAMLRILKGFGMRLLAFDPYPSAAALELGGGICRPRYTVQGVGRDLPALPADRRKLTICSIARRLTR
ncbi:hypothetical protein LNP17_13910 [Klebsiella variicola subsp. variicola]|nr:hypothetical protein [Klebsiella variicola subsp. variicola]